MRLALLFLIPAALCVFGVWLFHHGAEKAGIAFMEIGILATPALTALLVWLIGRAR